MSPSTSPPSIPWRSHKWTLHTRNMGENMVSRFDPSYRSLVDLSTTWSSICEALDEMDIHTAIRIIHVRIVALVLTNGADDDKNGEAYHNGNRSMLDMSQYIRRRTIAAMVTTASAVIYMEAAMDKKLQDQTIAFEAWTARSLKKPTTDVTPPTLPWSHAMQQIILSAIQDGIRHSRVTTVIIVDDAHRQLRETKQQLSDAKQQLSEVRHQMHNHATRACMFDVIIDNVVCTAAICTM